MVRCKGKAGGVNAAREEEINKIKEACSGSLKFLCVEMLGYGDWDKMHDEMAVFLGKPAKKKALIVPRGHLKSSIVTIGYTIKRILMNSNIRILIANQIWDMSRRFLSEIKAHLEGSRLKYIYGNFVSGRWNADDIIVLQRTKALKEPTVMTTGVEAETTGGHFDLIILDDLTGRENSQTPEQLEKTKRFRRSMTDLIDPGGMIIEVGTRWHLNDTFSDIIEKESQYYDIMVRKVVEDGRIIFPNHFSKRFDPVLKTWEPVPVENCMDYIDHLKTNRPIDEFSSQYYNEPVSLENQLFKKGYFKYWNKRPEGLYSVMAVDLAISQRTDADYTAIVVMGMDKDWNLYVLDYLKGRWTPAEIVDNIFDVQSHWKPMAVGMEVNGFQRTLKFAVEEEMRRRGQYFGVDEIRNGPERSKESRIKSLEPFYRRNAVYHAAWMEGKDMETELLTFPKGRHDDIADAMAMSLPFLSPGISITAPEMKPGTWEYVEREAHRYYNKGNFFNYSV